MTVSGHRPVTAEAFLSDLTTVAGGSALTIGPQDDLDVLQRDLTSWYHYPADSLGSSELGAPP
jgi:hypothetical protein